MLLGLLALVRADRQQLPNPLQLALDRAVVHRAANARNRTTKNLSILRITRPDFLSGHARQVSFKSAALVFAQFTRGGDFSFREPKTLVQFLRELRHNLAQEPRAPVIDQHSYKIPHSLR